MNRILWSTVPTTGEQRKPRVSDREEVERQDLTLKKKQKGNHDTHHGTRSLPPLVPEERVCISDREEEVTVKEEIGPESYHVTNPGLEYRRNRRHLIRLPAVPGNIQEQDEQTAPGTQLQPHEEKSLRRTTRITQPPDCLDPSWTKAN